MQLWGESTGVELLTEKIKAMKKRVILKKLSGSKKDTTTWFGIVLSASFDGRTLYQEKLVFVPETVWTAMTEGMEISVE